MCQVLSGMGRRCRCFWGSFSCILKQNLSSKHIWDTICSANPIFLESWLRHLLSLLLPFVWICSFCCFCASSSRTHCSSCSRAHYSPSPFLQHIKIMQLSLCYLLPCTSSCWKSKWPLEKLLGSVYLCSLVWETHKHGLSSKLHLAVSLCDPVGSSDFAQLLLQAAKMWVKGADVILPASRTHCIPAATVWGYPRQLNLHWWLWVHTSPPSGDLLTLRQPSHHIGLWSRRWVIVPCKTVLQCNGHVYTLNWLHPGCAGQIFEPCPSDFQKRKKICSWTWASSQK